MTQNTREFRTVPKNVDIETGYPQAATVRIGGRELWVGDGGAAVPEHLDIMDLDVEHVVTVNRRETEATTDFHPLTDGRVNDQAEFDAAVEAARNRYRAEGVVLIHCAAGISRSTTVTATTLAAEEDRSFTDALDIVKQHRRKARPHPKVRLNAYRYLAGELDRSEAAEEIETLKSQITPTRSDDLAE